MQVKGMDVSYCDRNVDWNKVANSGIKFAIIRAGYGRELSQKDVMFEKHYAGAKAAGVPVGAYWYSYATSEAEAKKEAAVCIEIIKGKQFEYPIWFDIEEKRQFALGKAKCSALCRAFCEALEDAGYWAGIYCSKSHLESYISEEVRNRFAIWVAHYGVSKTSYSGQYGMWQYTSSGQVSGITGVDGVDLDYCYVDYPTLIKNKGLNGFKANTAASTNTAAATKEESYTTYVVKKGDTLWGIATEFLGSGSYYKEIMKASGISSETIYPNQVLKVPKK